MYADPARGTVRENGNLLVNLLIVAIYLEHQIRRNKVRQILMQWQQLRMKLSRLDRPWSKPPDQPEHRFRDQVYFRFLKVR